MQAKRIRVRTKRQTNATGTIHLKIKTPKRISSNMIANEWLKLNNDIKLKTKYMSWKLTDSNSNITLANLNVKTNVTKSAYI